MPAYINREGRLSHEQGYTIDGNTIIYDDQIKMDSNRKIHVEKGAKELIFRKGIDGKWRL